MNRTKWWQRLRDWTDPSRDLWLWIMAGLFVGSMMAHAFGIL